MAAIRHSPKAVRERRRNAKRYAEKPWRKWYQLKAWRDRRRVQLAAHPLCERCLSEAKIVPATVANHMQPHRGDWNLFISGPLQSLCAPCHDKDVQEIESKGFSTAVAEDGWPSDGSHPANR